VASDVLPDDDELYEVDQTYLDPPRRYIAPMRHKVIFAWLVIGPLKFVSTHKLGLPFTVLTVGLLRPSTSRSSNAGAPAGSKAWSGVQCCVDMTMPMAWLMTDRLDRALRRSRWPPLPQTPQGPGVQYVLAMLRPGDCGRGRTLGGGCQARREEC
jgi:hypothetical protein